MTKKVGIVALPFEYWRLLLSQDELRPLEQAASIVKMMEQQISQQIQHANCENPTLSIEKEDEEGKHYRLTLKCSCTAILFHLDKIPSEALEAIGPKGVFIPMEKGALN